MLAFLFREALEGFDFRGCAGRAFGDADVES